MHKCHVSTGSVKNTALLQVKEVYSEALGVTSGLGLMMVRIGAGMTTGTLAILAAQPTDVVKVQYRVQSLHP